MKYKSRKVAKMCLGNNENNKNDILCNKCMEEPGCEKKIYQEKCQCFPSFNQNINVTNQNINEKKLENHMINFYKYSNNYLNSLNFVKFIEFMLVLNNYNANPYQYYLYSLNRKNCIPEDLILVNAINNNVIKRNNSNINKLMDNILKIGIKNNEITIEEQLNLLNIVLNNICPGLNIININKLSKINLAILVLLIINVMYTEGINHKPLGNVIQGFDHYSKLFLNSNSLSQKGGGPNPNTNIINFNSLKEKTYNYDGIDEDETNINILVEEQSKELANIFSNKNNKGDFSLKVINAMNPESVTNIDFKTSFDIKTEEKSKTQILKDSFFNVLVYILPLLVAYIIIIYGENIHEIVNVLFTKMISDNLKQKQYNSITTLKNWFSGTMSFVEDTATNIAHWTILTTINNFKDLILATIMSTGLTAVGSIVFLGINKLDNYKKIMSIQEEKKKSENKIKKLIKNQLNSVKNEQNSLLKSVIDKVNDSFVSMGDKKIQNYFSERGNEFSNMLIQTRDTQVLKKVQENNCWVINCNSYSCSSIIWC